ncbi:hypothetical protein [Diplocloster hominis]|uniref:hypothetical protein n=1 Tax=Diplocloster hominis TaxID=3079010 RepID=UPI0031BA5EE4
MWCNRQAGSGAGPTAGTTAPIIRKKASQNYFPYHLSAENAALEGMVIPYLN